MDSSGDTFLFTSFLAASDPSGWTIAPDTTVTWPNVPGALSAMGNGGMVTTCQTTPGCVAYIGISYLKRGHHGRPRLRRPGEQGGPLRDADDGVDHGRGGQLHQLHAGQREQSR